jgi:3-hydroxybutyryl-CoA dehydrogenase
MLEINAVAIIGAGTAGRRIAESTALAGFRTLLVDILPSSLRQAQSEMRDRLRQAQDLGRLSPVAANAALQRLEITATVAEAAREADLVVEAVPDEMESKLEIFLLLDKIARPDTILASTTSSLSVSEIASVTYRKPKILGMRFRFPADSTAAGCLQIVPTQDTGEETIHACATAGRRMRLDVEIVNEITE